MSKYHQLSAHFDSLSSRERGLVLLVILALIYSGWNYFLMQPLKLQKRRLPLQIQTVLQEEQSLKQAIQNLKNHGSLDPEEEKRKLLNTLREKMAGQKGHIQRLLDTLISPKNMSVVLESLLTQHARLTLLKVENLPPQALFEAEPSAQKASQLFKHSLRLEFRGNYMNTLAYIRMLENLPWKLYWDDLEIDLEENYPQAHITLTVHTFSWG